MDFRNGPTIQVLKNAIAREQEKIERAQRRIFEYELELADLGVELPLGDPGRVPAEGI